MSTAKRVEIFTMRGFDGEFNAKAEAGEFKAVEGKADSTIFYDKSASFPLPKNYGVECSVVNVFGAIPYLVIDGGEREWCAIVAIGVTAKDINETVAIEKIERWISDTHAKLSKVMVR